MSPKFKIYSVLFAVILLSGCATDLMGKKGSAMMAARYGDLEKHALEEVPDMAKSKTVKLFPLCMAYAKLKKYNKLFPCLDQVEVNVKNGDTNMVDIEQMEKDSPFMMGLAKMGSGMAGVSLEQDVSPYLYIMRAEAFMDIGEYGKAVEDAKRGIAAKPKQWNLEKWHEINTLGALTLAYALGGDREKAFAHAKQMEAISTSYPHGLLAIDKHVWLAKTYVALGEYQRALHFMEIKESFFDGFARGVADAMVGSSTRGESMWEFQMLPAEFLRYKCQFEVGKFKEAKAGYDELLKKSKIRDNGDIYWLILFDRGRIAEKEGDLKGAAGYYRQAVDVIEQQRSTINTETSKIGFVGDKQAVYRQLVAALFADRQYAAAFEYVERSKSRALVDMLAAKQDFAVVSGDPDKVKNLLAMASNAEIEAMLQGAVTEKPQTRSLVVSARQQLQGESPELASLINVSSLATSEIQALIPPDEALIEYYYNAPDLIAFVLTDKGLSAVRLDSGSLLESVRQYRKQLESANTVGYLDLSKQLYNQLLRPVVAQINVKKLIIVAHGPLHYLPFNALHDGQDYLIERYSLRMLPSASVLKYLRAEPVAKQGNLLAFGNPDLGNPQFDLAYAQDEAIAITKNRPQSKVLLRKDANETALRQYGGGFRYLHFATHGEFNADAPLKSALRLAKDEQSDGLLTVDKLYSIKLDADLVTLSACETGLGKIANGDDVVGLTRGFLYAGSRSIVASLWQVDDLATSYLMTRFYDNLQQTDKREALRQAQLDTRKKYAHPFYWAAFQITGSAQ
ncbi:MAG: CHAT domain-containing protein [Gallionella sp.]|nr:CHAT domain-containing protein [Gallionella sp.]